MIGSSKISKSGIFRRTKTLMSLTEVREESLVSDLASEYTQLYPSSSGEQKKFGEISIMSQSDVNGNLDYAILKTLIYDGKTFLLYYNPHIVGIRPEDKTILQEQYEEITKINSDTYQEWHAGPAPRSGVSSDKSDKKDTNTSNPSKSCLPCCGSSVSVSKPVKDNR